MKFIRFNYNKKEGYGLLENDTIKFIDGDIFNTYIVTGQTVKMDDVKILPPTNPSKIVCVGLNYLDHQKEMNEFTDQFPKLFIKPNTCVISDNENIISPVGVDRVDFEGELAVVIKKTAKSIAKGSAKEYILGYTCLNDVTAREIQKLDGQWTRAKSFDTFAPVGPVIETDIDPNNALLKTLVNGKLRQNANTNLLIWNIDFLIEEISKIMTLLPGDIITTGTPSGCGKLEIGDKVEVVIEGIGTLTNYLVGG